MTFLWMFHRGNQRLFHLELSREQAQHAALLRVIHFGGHRIIGRHCRGDEGPGLRSNNDEGLELYKPDFIF